MDNIKSIDYSDNFELLMKEEAEKAECMSILHFNSSLLFSRLSTLINIPVIILSSIVGFLSPLDLFYNQGLFLGGLSIIIGIIKTLDNYFDFTKRSETHRMTALNYIRISKWIELQLSLERVYRVQAQDLFDIINNDLQNIRDAEPIVPKKIIAEFNLKYKDEKTKKPNITNGLTEIKINKNTIKDKIEIVIEEKKEIKKPAFKI